MRQKISLRYSSCLIWLILGAKVVIKSMSCIIKLLHPPYVDDCARNPVTCMKEASGGLEWERASVPRGVTRRSIYSRKTPSKNVRSASLSPLIGLIHDFTAHEAGATHAACRFCGQGCHRLAPISTAPEEAGGDLGGLPSPGLDEGGREEGREGRRGKRAS